MNITKGKVLSACTMMLLLLAAPNQKSAAQVAVVTNQTAEALAAALVGGGAPRFWTLPWVDAWRHTDTTALPAVREYQRFITDLAALATATNH